MPSPTPPLLCASSAYSTVAVTLPFVQLHVQHTSHLTFICLTLAASAVAFCSLVGCTELFTYASLLLYCPLPTTEQPQFSG